MSKPTGKTYRIEKIADLLDVPAEKLDECWADVRAALAIARITRAICAWEHVPFSMPAVEWTDDGKREATAHMRDCEISILAKTGEI